MRRIVLLFIAFFLISCGSNQRSQENTQSEKPIVTAVNYPLYYFAQQIGGELIQLEYPIPSDVDPAYWIPDDEALTIYQSADIILANGAGYAKWMNNVSLPSSRIKNTSSSVEEKYIRLKNVSTHSHGPEGEHEHTGYAFTTWLDFEMASAQAKTVKEILVNKLPDSVDEITENYNSLNARLLALHESMKAIARKIITQNIIGSHPVYQYLAEAYGLNIQSVHFEPDEMPSEDQWKEFDQLLEHHSASIMLWEDEPLSEVKEILNTKGVQALVFNPCGNMPESGDFIDIMSENIENLKNSLTQYQIIQK